MRLKNATREISELGDAHGDGELLIAVAALVETFPDLALLAGLDRVDALDTATMYADDAIRPAQTFEVFAGCFVVVESFFSQVTHGDAPTVESV